MNILILGGTGAMGAHLVEILRNTENCVYVTTRRNYSDIENIRYLTGNAHNDTFLRKILDERKWDVIVDFMIYSSTEFQNRVDRFLSSCAQYVYISSARVYADSQAYISEESPRLLDNVRDNDYLKTDEYALSKARGENALMRSKRNNWTIIRPYITYSEQRLQLGIQEKEDWLYRALHGRTIVFSKDIANKITTLTYALDVAKGIKAILGNKEAFGETFHITSDESHRWQEIFDLYREILSEHLGYEPKIMFIEKEPRVNSLHGKWQVLYDRHYNRRFDNRKIKQFIDTTDFQKTKDTMSRCLNVFLADPHFNIKGWTSHAMYDRITGEWTPLYEIPTWKQRLKYLLRRTIFPKYNKK